MTTLDTSHVRNAGFFSHCTVRLTKLMGYYKEHGILPDAIDSTGNWHKYKDSTDINGDISSRFFKNRSGDVNINGPLVYNKLGADIMPLKCHHADYDQFTDFSNMNYEHTNEFVREYFSLSDEVLAVKDAIVNKYNIDTSKTIGVCYRGNDKVSETRIPTHHDVMGEVRDIMGDRRVLLQSDVAGIYQDFINAGIQHVDVVETARIQSNPGISVPDLISDGYKTHQAIIFLAVMSILSECDKLVLNTGNVGLWVCLLRGNCDGVSQYSNGEWIRH